MRKAVALFGVVIACLMTVPAIAGATLDDVRQRGYLRCGVDSVDLGFSKVGEDGAWSGYNVDYCRAVAAAVLGGADRVRFRRVDNSTRFTVLQAGEIDLLSYATTLTLSREGGLNMLFPGTLYYDGQGFMTKKSSGIRSVKDMARRSVCVMPSTTTVDNLKEFSTANKLDLKTIQVALPETMMESFTGGRCDMVTTDLSYLYTLRLANGLKPEAYIILPDVISKEPLGPTVRDDDVQWFKIVRWVIGAVIEAEERGITSASVDAARDSTDPGVRRLLGVTPELGKALGLDEAWAYRAIKQVGNYGEIFERNLGSGSPLKIDRGLNNLWNKGGLIYALPLQ